MLAFLLPLAFIMVGWWEAEGGECKLSKNIQSSFIELVFYHYVIDYDVSGRLVNIPAVAIVASSKMRTGKHRITAPKNTAPLASSLATSFAVHVPLEGPLPLVRFAPRTTATRPAQSTATPVEERAAGIRIPGTITFIVIRRWEGEREEGREIVGQ